MDGLEVFTRGGHLNNVNKYGRYSELLADCADGFTSDEILSVFHFLANNKVNQMCAPLIGVCLPCEPIDNRVIRLAINLLKQAKGSLFRPVLSWILAGIHNFFTEDNVKYLRLQYPYIFLLLRGNKCLNLLSAILCSITVRLHVCRFRVAHLERFILRAGDMSQQSLKAYLSLLRVYRMLRPDLVLPSSQAHIVGGGGGASSNSATSGSINEHDDRIIPAELRTNLARWRVNAGSQGVFASRQNGAVTSLWQQPKFKSNLLKRCAELPVPERYGLARQSRSARGLDASVSIVTVHSIEAAVTRVAVCGARRAFAPLNCVTPLLLDQRRRPLLLLSGPVNKHLLKAQTDVAVHLRTLWHRQLSSRLHPPNHQQQQDSGAPSTLLASALGVCSVFVAELSAVQRGALRVPLDLRLLHSLLLSLTMLMDTAAGSAGDCLHGDSARYISANWIPLLALVESGCWLPFQEMRAVLAALCEMASRCDRLVKQTTMRAITGLVVALIEEQLPAVRACRFPYNSPVYRELIDSCGDVKIQMSKTADTARQLLEEICDSVPGDTVMLNCLITYCRHVSAALSSQRIPMIILLSVQRVENILCASDAVLLNNLLAMFSEYQQLTRDLDNASMDVTAASTRSMRKLTRSVSDTTTNNNSSALSSSSVGDRHTMLLRESLRCMSHAERLLNDVYRVIFTTDRARPAHAGRQMEVLFAGVSRDEADTNRDRLTLFNHTALWLYRRKYSRQHHKSARVEDYVSFLADHGLTGFQQFYRIRSRSHVS